MSYLTIIKVFLLVYCSYVGYYILIYKKVYDYRIDAITLFDTYYQYSDI